MREDLLKRIADQFDQVLGDLTEDERNDLLWRINTKFAKYSAKETTETQQGLIVNE